MDVFLSKNHEDWGAYFSTTRNLTKVKQSFNWTVKMLQASDPNCRFGFGFGKFTGNVYFDNVSIEKQVPTSIEPIISSVDAFELFPNPASDFLEITNRSNKTTQPTIALYNLHGQLISNLWNKQSIAPGQQIRVNLKECNAPNGIYLVNISTPEKSVTRKLIISR
jgi:hypothetical protein